MPRPFFWVMPLMARWRCRAVRPPARPRPARRLVYTMPLSEGRRGGEPCSAQGAGKLAIDQGLEGSLADGLKIETSHFVGLFTTQDAKIGVDSFLANGPGKAKFVGR